VKKFCRTHFCLKSVAKKVTHGLTSLFLQIIKAFHVKITKQKCSATFLPFLKNLQKIRPLFLPAAEIILRPLLRFAAEILVSWQQ
jgi:hypothetical protein